MKAHFVSRCLIAGLVLLVLLSGRLLPLPSAGADPTVPTVAQIDASSTPPIVEWAWELPDMDSVRAGIQYIPAGGLDIHDDDMTRVPATPPQSANMMQVAPNLENLPQMRHIQYWAAVEDPNGIADITSVFADVFYPDGRMMARLTLAKVACTALGSKNTVGSVLEAAVHSGQMTATEADLIVEKCLKNEKVIYSAVKPLSKDEPSGSYRVQVTAVDQSGGTNVMTNYFDVLSVVGLRIDFSAVGFGDIVPNTKKWLAGDYKFLPPSDLRPTVKNVGNDPMKLSLLFSKMVGSRFGKEITQFDAQLDPSPLGGTDVEKIDPIQAGVPVTFTRALLTANQLGQLDLSIDPGPIPADTYAGTLALTGSK